jgi:hypothetical protein
MGPVPLKEKFYKRILGLQRRAFVGRADFNNLVTHIVECIKSLTTTHSCKQDSYIPFSVSSP